MIATLEPVHPHVVARSIFRRQSCFARRSNARSKVCSIANGTAYTAAPSPPHAGTNRKKVVIVGGPLLLKQRDQLVLVLHTSTRRSQLKAALLLVQLRDSMQHLRRTSMIMRMLR